MVTRFSKLLEAFLRNCSGKLWSFQNSLPENKSKCPRTYFHVSTACSPKSQKVSVPLACPSHLPPSPHPDLSSQHAQPHSEEMVLSTFCSAAPITITAVWLHAVCNPFTELVTKRFTLRLSLVTCSQEASLEIRGFWGRWSWAGLDGMGGGGGRRGSGKLIQERDGRW